MTSFLRACLVGSLTLIALSASAATWNVQQTGCDDMTCTPCCTIQAAIERCQGGDTVSVGPGTYPENLDLGDMAAMGTITLEASGGPGTVLVSPAGGAALKHWVLAAPGTVTIDGIDFTSPDSFTSPTSSCEVFESGMESGSLHEWSVVVNPQP